MHQRTLNWILVLLAVPPAIAGAVVVLERLERLPFDWRVFIGTWAVSLASVLCAWWMYTVRQSVRRDRRDAKVRGEAKAKAMLLRDMRLLKRHLSASPSTRGEDRIAAMKAIMVDSRMHALGLFTFGMTRFNGGKEVDPRPGLLDTYIAVLEERSYSYLMNNFSRRRPVGAWRRAYERTMDFIEDSPLFYAGWAALDGVQWLLDRGRAGARAFGRRVGNVWKSRVG